MHEEVNLKMADGGWIVLQLRFSDRSRFNWFLGRLKHALHVVIWDKPLNKYKTSVYELKRLSDLCELYNIELFVTDKVMNNYRRLQYKHAKTEEIRALKEHTLKPELWTDDKEKQLRHYQSMAVELLVFRKRFLLGDDMGLGKTPQAIGTMLYSWQKHGFSDGLFVVANRLMTQWKEEIISFTKIKPNQIELLGERKCRTGARTHFLGNGKECKACRFYDICQYDSETDKKSSSAYRDLQIRRAKVLICGYTAMRLHTKEFKNRKFEVTIFDEATKMKNRTSGVSKGAKEIVDSLPLSHIVIPMSGTFIENRLEELYTVMDLIDPRVLGGFSNFKNRHLTMDHFVNVVSYRNEESLKFKLDNVLIRRTIDEVWHDRPELEETTVECPMAKEQEKFYKEARDGVLKQVADLEKAKQINQASIGALLTYLLMICSTVKSVDPDNEMKEHSSKAEMLKEILQGNFSKSSKMVIFSRFTNKVTPYLLEEMRSWDIGKVLIVGDKNKQDKVVSEFKNDPEARFMVCSDAMAYGANFQFANYLVNFDLPWNPAILDQRVRRVYRGGQKRNVIVYNFLVPGTAEEHLFQVLQRKRQLSAKYLKESVTGSETQKFKKASMSVSEMLKMI